MSNLGTVLRELRNRGRFKRAADLAQRIGVSARSIQLYEAGKKVPGAETLQRLTMATGATPDEIDRVQQLRAAVLAVRTGCPPPTNFTCDAEVLAKSLAAEAVRVLRQRSRAVTERDAAALTARFARVLHVVMNGADGSVTPPAK